MKYQWERKNSMTKKKNLAVKEVEVVLAVFKEYVDSKKDMPCEVLEDVVNKMIEVEKILTIAEKDYDRTIKELLFSNSLLVKFEQLFEMIGTLGTISVEDEKKLDKTIAILQSGIESIKD